MSLGGNRLVWAVPDGMAQGDQWPGNPETEGLRGATCSGSVAACAPPISGPVDPLDFLIPPDEQRRIVPEHPRNPDQPPMLQPGVSPSPLAICGGVAGLSAALELAERGFELTISEAGNVIGHTVGNHENFTSFETGQGSIRPFPRTPAELGLANLLPAGDWVAAPVPSALMERSVLTGRPAANECLVNEGVREVGYSHVSPLGPALQPAGSVGDRT